MRINEFNEAQLAANEDYFIIQKNDSTEEIQKIKAQNLSLGSSSFSYSRSSGEPVLANDGDVWDEIIGASSLKQRWIRSADKWQSPTYVFDYSVLANNDSFYVFKIDERYDFLVNGYFGSITNLSGKGYPSGTPPIGMRIRFNQDNFSSYFGGGFYKEVASSKLNNNQTEKRSDYIGLTTIPKNSNKNAIVNIRVDDSSWTGLVIVKLHYAYLR